MPRKIHTKFIVTLGPKSGNYETMKGLAESGANIFRANFAHMDYDIFRQWRQWLDQINHELGTEVQLQADIQGPNIRLGDLGNEKIFLQAQKDYVFATQAGLPEPGDIPVNDATIQNYVQAGQPISFSSGVVEGEIIKVEGHRLFVKMINSGSIATHKTINFPETQIDCALTDKDWRDIDFILGVGVDWIALSFVTGNKELGFVREKIGDRKIRLMSKIERQAAVANMDEIIKASDAVMVARGDLGVEIPLEDVPIIQKEIVEICHHERKPAVIATQMLLSMTESMRPTRAEVTDVATAVFERCDAVMLSEETAQGIDPINALQTMVKIVRRSEEHLYREPNYFEQYWG